MLLLFKFPLFRSVNNNSDSQRTKNMEHCVIVRDVALQQKIRTLRETQIYFINCNYVFKFSVTVY
jgi:hypothetical protein